jgi:hypothetical protein
MADVEEKSVPFVANGATSLRFRMVFGKELMDSISNIINKVGIDKLAGMMKAAESAQAAGDGEIALSDMNPEMIGAAIAIVGSGEMNTVSQLAYIMNSSAEGKDMKTLDIDGYLDWLEQFETMEFIVHAMDIIMLYMNNRATTSKPKKKEDQLIGK